MGYLTDFLQHLAKRKAAISEFPVPWEPERISIHDFLKEHLAKNTDNLPFKDVDLPDEEKLSTGESVIWAAGAKDGAFGHHGMPGDDKGAEDLFTSLQRVSTYPTSQNIQTLYARMLEYGALDTADHLYSRLLDDRSINPTHLRALAERIARESPDREPVKLAIVLLGIFSDAAHRDLIFTLGRHDEFTLYAAVALARIVPDGEREAIWWQLAQGVDGWGRIHLVDRLADTNNPEIKAWLLREGYRNTIMNEYLAYACAKDGNLLAALRHDTVDDALLRGAGDILEALAIGGPAEGMDAYAEGTEAALLYVKHMSRKSSADDIESFLPLRALRRFADDEERNWEVLTPLGWTATARQEISKIIGLILARPEWSARVKQALSDGNDRDIEIAALLADLFGIDPWPYLFERQKAGTSDHWYSLMQEDDPERIDQVLDLAVTQFDLVSLPSGPGLKMALGPEFREHGKLDWVLQRLDAFPGKGWSFLDAGLQSPVISNRWKALRALNVWGKQQWPKDAEFALFRALSREPDEELKRDIKRVLDGVPLD